MLSDVGGGHSWAVEKSPLGVLETGVQARVSFGPPLHFIVVASQIGQGWMKVVQIPPGQSASIMHPLPSFVPPEQAPVSQVAAMLQSASEQQTAPLSVHRPLSLTHVPPGQEPGAPFGSGNGGPNWQPAFVHFRNLQVPPGQSAFVVQLPLVLEPPEQRLPPASAAVAAVSVIDVPLHAEILEIEVPLSGTWNGSGTPTLAPPT